MNHPVPGKWTTPDVDQAAKNLIGLGARALVFAPSGFVTENHETQIDVGSTIGKVGGRAEVAIDHLANGAFWLDARETVDGAPVKERVNSG